MILREENFACIKINWNDKLSNMQEIANELNIGLESIVFVDDSKNYFLHHNLNEYSFLHQNL